MTAIFKISFLFLFFAVIIKSQDKVIKKETQVTYLQKESGKLFPEGPQIIKLYNRNGLVLEESNKRFWEEVQRDIDYITKYYYGNRNLPDSSNLFENKKKILTLIYSYDSTGLATSVSEVLPNGKESSKTFYFYNQHKKKFRECLYNSKKELNTEKEYKYDMQNNLIEEFGKERGVLRYRWIYLYDKNNRLIERKDFDGAGNLVRLHFYENNKVGNLLKETESTYQGKGKIVRVIKYFYEYY